ncbi:MAG: hypothetical protein U0995_09645 [Erythrobacter sp.]|nr:hypothetical protein [Erythrobacter sp.]MDZ4273243.1 hypothetical protein [Erythrobacter sp.]MDZ4276291.1 hypothetical protein [Erythrobacter sp.]
MIRLLLAIIAARDVFTGRAERIAVPGQWRAWRDGRGVVFELTNRKD